VPSPVSAVVVNYNGVGYLGACLDAILSQTHPVDELIVVDNASQDESRGLLRAQYPRARVIALERNDGPAPARNVGLRAARNRWVLLVDNDAVLAPDVLGKLIAAASQAPKAAICQPRSVLDAEPSTVHYDGGRFHYAGLFSLRNFYCPLELAEGRGTLAVDGAVSVALLTDRDVLLEWGGFDESFFILFEDLDLSLRLRLVGFEILSVEDAIVRHRAGTPGISFREAGRYPDSRIFFHSRNRWLTLIKNYRFRTLFCALPGLCLYELVWGLFALRSGSLKAYCAGKLAFLRRLRPALEQRSAIQRGRVRSDRSLLVGGPLTLAPHLSRSKATACAIRWLDRALTGWWKVCRPLCG
jgi:GT2 family glycosyltransferase